MFSTHVVAELEQVADYLIVLGRGAVLLSGPTAELTAAHGGQSPSRSSCPPCGSTRSTLSTRRSAPRATIREAAR